MKFWKIISISALIFTSIASATTAGDIALGKIIGIKHYDLNNAKLIKLYFNRSDIRNSDCVERDMAYATITSSKHDEASMSRMLSMALSAHMADKSVRFFSESKTCEIDLIGIQSTYY